MSIKERLQCVSSEQELHEVMREMWAFGSPNWTFDSAMLHVPARFWWLLDRYFDPKGRLLPRPPEPPVPHNGGSSVSSEEPDMFAPEAGDEEANLPDSGRAVYASCGSISELIRIFHTQLELVRATTPSLTARTPTPTMASTGVHEEPAAIGLPLPQTAEEEYEQAPSDLEPVVGIQGFLCPICEIRTDMEPVIYRRTEMCVACAILLRERG